MSLHPILLIGGSGIVGRWTARLLRAAHSDTPLLIGGRDLGKARQAAAEIGDAEGVAVDLAAGDLGLGQRPVSAVAVFFTDERVASLRFAQARRAPYISISPGLNEIGPEVAAYIHDREAAPVVLGTEWLVGATSIPTLELAKEVRKGKICDITCKPENLLLNIQATEIESSRFCGYLHDDKTRSDLMEMADAYELLSIGSDRYLPMSALRFAYAAFRL